MKRFIVIKVLLLGLSVTPALAEQRSITLAVENMYCAACPYIVKGSLLAVPGVTTVEVSFQNKTAVITYDDAIADVATLTQATAEAGYPSAPKS